MSAPAYRVNTPTVAAETVDGEVLMIHLESGNYYSLRASGAAIWDGVEHGIATTTIVATVRDRFGAPDAEQLVGAFLTELVDEDLVAPADGPGATEWEPPKFVSEFAPPALEKFTDMQHLILLDPVHEVDAGKGWPIQRSDT
jgi:hypothetical protein